MTTKREYERKYYLFTHLDDKSAFYGKRGQSHKTKAAASQVEKPKKEETHEGKSRTNKMMLT